MLAVQVPSQEISLYESSSDDRIVDFEVFKHYLAVLHEKDFQRQLKGTFAILCHYEYSCEFEDSEGAHPSI